MQINLLSVCVFASIATIQAYPTTRDTHRDGLSLRDVKSRFESPLKTYHGTLRHGRHVSFTPGPGMPLLEDLGVTIQQLYQPDINITNTNRSPAKPGTNNSTRNTRREEEFDCRTQIMTEPKPQQGAWKDDVIACYIYLMRQSENKCIALRYAAPLCQGTQGFIVSDEDSLANDSDNSDNDNSNSSNNDGNVNGINHAPCEDEDCVDDIVPDVKPPTDIENDYYYSVVRMKAIDTGNDFEKCSCRDVATALRKLISNCSEGSGEEYVRGALAAHGAGQMIIEVLAVKKDGVRDLKLPSPLGKLGNIEAIEG